MGAVPAGLPVLINVTFIMFTHHSGQVQNGKLFRKKALLIMRIYWSYRVHAALFEKKNPVMRNDRKAPLVFLGTYCIYTSLVFNTIYNKYYLKLDWFFLFFFFAFTIFHKIINNKNEIM